MDFWDSWTGLMMMINCFREIVLSKLGAEKKTGSVKMMRLATKQTVKGY